VNALSQAIYAVKPEALAVQQATAAEGKG